MCPFFFAATLDCCSDTRKSLGPSAPIAYATSVSPPNEAIAWPGRGYQMGNKAVAWLSFRCWVLDDAATLDCCSNRRKSFGTSAPIAYATSVSPPDEAIAWLGRWYQVLDEAAAWQGVQVLDAR